VDTQFQTILTLLQGEASSIMFWIRPSSQGGSPDYGLGLLKKNLELSQVNYITDDSGLAILQSLLEGSSSLIIIQGHLEATSFTCCLSLFSLDSLLQMDQTLGCCQCTLESYG